MKFPSPFRLGLLSFGFLFAAAAVVAQPSGGFYLFKNQQTGQSMCLQWQMSPDWIKQAGPFADHECKVPEQPASAEQQKKRASLPANPLELTPPKR
ncbi:hypothetical protein FFI97_027825 [Variovorax sp. KBS0712]|uniref:hypothetical protein n=1 Tax=Variovorax sp. KBS0712 TaxID=2578111 RepID=UPI0011193CBB|nr:hypothetical protein [Variovorax sp. KBS0712]TSD55155.1 hypothetical protein FFI97_027825 [Variovorax sp. KBS0712]